jgi:PKD repeat protein
MKALMCFIIFMALSAVFGIASAQESECPSSDTELFSTSVQLNAVPEGPALDWQRCLGGSMTEILYSIQETNDGGYITAGYAYSYDGDVSGHHGGWTDAWVVKLNSDGTFQWQQCLGGTGDDSAWSIIQTNDGGYSLAGRTTSDNGDVSGNHGGGDAWVVKINLDREIEWQRCLGGSGDDSAYSIQQTGDDGFIIAGDTYSNDGNVSGNHGGADAWVVKLDRNGTLEWQQCLGGSNYDCARSIRETDDGGYIIAGETHSNDGNVSGNHGSADAWVVKLNSGGALQWQKCLGGTSGDTVYSIEPAEGGGYLIAGETHSDDGDVSGKHGKWDGWVVKLDSGGTPEWQRCLGGSEGDSLRSIVKISDGSFITAGVTYSNDGDVSGNHGSGDYWVVKPAPESDVKKPDANFSADKTTGTSPLRVNFTDLSKNNATSWNWTFGDGGISETRNPVHIYTSAGNYTVSLTVSNDAGDDTDTKTDYIIVYPKGDFNHNGVVDIGDASKVAYMLVKIVPEDPGADFNFNGFVDIGDVSKIAYYIAGKTAGL